MRNDMALSPAWELAQGIQQRMITSTDVVESVLQRIDAYNSQVNAVIGVDIDDIRRQAREADAKSIRDEALGSIHGLPITLKDTFETEGMRTTAGDPSLADYVPSQDATVVARLRQAGAIIIGKTNVPPMANGIQTDNPVFGRTNNPWNLEMTAGGSSGGAAAALVTGMTLLDVGSDLGGSLRIPAHFCNVVTLKPTEHLVPRAGHIPPVPGQPRLVRHLSVVGPMARSVADLRMLLNIIAGPDHRTSETVPVPLTQIEAKPLSELRIAWTDSFPGVPASRETRQAIERFAGALSQNGATVARILPENFDFQAAWDIQQRLVRMMVPDRRERDVNEPTYAEYIDLLTEREHLIAMMDTFLTDWDVWLCPVAPAPAFPHCEPGTQILIDGDLINYSLMNAYCTVFNVTGSPSLVLPLALSDTGLPIGMQLVGKRWSDAQLLMIGEQLEAAMGARPRPPGV
jgi:amidase